MKPGVKSTIFILMLVLAISLTGCVNENSDNGNNQNENENTKKIIYSSSPEDISQLTMLETFKYDFDLDGTEEEMNW
jgi:PBP1b-binding outer membrane lipoprotein LpoB